MFGESRPSRARVATDNSTTKVVSEKITSPSSMPARPEYAMALISADTASTCETTPSTVGCRLLEFGHASDHH
ncbi:hypothetical protein [Streptomyces sp. NPDC101776]|uniref:hypothetical protein n=1 Tax=Streptomyces sp. NPDC101776 TaxID=3366146 RepID=UPI0037F7F616